MQKIKALAIASTLYSIPTFVAGIAAILLLPIYTRYLSPADYGILSLLAVLSGFGLTFSNFKLESGLYRYHAHFETENERRDFLGTLFITKWLISAAIAIIILGVGGILYSFGLGYSNIPYLPFIVAQTFIIFFASCSGFQLAMWVAEEKPRINTLIMLLNFFLINGSALYFIVAMNQGAWGKIKAMLVVECLVFICLTPITVKKINFKFSSSYLKQSLQFSLPLFFSGLTHQVLLHSDRIILASFADISKIGLLHIADRLASTITMAWTGFEKAIVPYIFNNTDDKNQKTILINAYDLWVIVASLILLCYLLVIEVIATYLLDDAYQTRELFIATKLLAVSYFFVITYPFFSIALGISEKTKFNLRVTVIITILNVVLNIIFIPIYGWLVAPLTTMISSFLTFCLLWLYALYKSGIKFRLSVTFLCVSICLIIYYSVDYLFDPITILGELARISLVILFYLFASYLLFDIKGKLKIINQSQTNA